MYGVGYFSVTPFSRLRRQTHPASTIAKLPTQDNNVFIPIVGPTQIDQKPQQNNVEFSNSDTLVDYLLPPNPNAQFTSLNFQDPSANLQNIDNFFDIAPTPSSSNTVNSFQSSQNQFPSGPGNFQNPINVAPGSQSSGTDQVQSISFQNAPLPPSQSLPFSSPAQPSSNTNQFIQSKESSPFGRELNNANQFKNSNQFKPNNNFVKSDPFVLEQSNQGKWDLGFDANDILAPPNPEAGRNEYDTINGNKFKKPNNIQPPLLTNHLEPLSPVVPQNNNFAPPNSNFIPPNPVNNQFPAPNNQFTPSNQFSQSTNQFQQPANQFPQQNNQFFPNQFTPQNNFGQFNQPAPNQFSNNQFSQPNPQLQFTQQNPQPSPNTQFSTINQFPPNKDNLIVNDQPDIIWGSQKQATNFNPTTAAPFLPTIPPNTNTQPSTNFQNTNNGFVNNQNLQQFPSQQLNSDQIYQLPNNVNHQNYPLDTPLTSQFDSFLPQGTVSDHSFFPINENVRHFQRKRDIDDEEEDEHQRQEEDEEVEEPYYESKSKFKTGPVYSFVKTDKNGHFKWSVRHPSRR